MKLGFKSIIGTAAVVTLLLSGCSNSDKIALQQKKQAEVIAEYTAAADRGELFAISQLGAMYWHGQGVKKDYKKAVEYFTIAAEKGDAKSMFNMGVAYERGTGVVSSKTQAFKWWIKAVDAGSENAAFNLDQLCNESPWACKTYSAK